MKKTFIGMMVVLALGACTNCKQSSQEVVVENIMSRVSVRSFTDEKPSDAQIETLLRCAMAAPSAMNKQPWAFVVVDDPALLKQIGDSLPNTRVQNNAQVCFVILGDLRKTAQGDAEEFWIHDCSAATENLLLAAHSMGLGAVWCAIQPGQERINKLRRILNIPQYLMPLCVVPVGYPAEKPQVKEKYKEENIFHNAWQE